MRFKARDCLFPSAEPAAPRRSLVLSGLGRLWRTADDQHYLGVVDTLAPHHAITRLPRQAVVAQSRDQVRARCDLSVLGHAAHLDDPLTAVAGPKSLGKASFG